ncbi:peptidase S8/S53 domain-containing protein [Syncephalis fuscata]|nr:peptidase S8/S53 domain-containing protein [Syncephalis fuscata]
MSIIKQAFDMADTDGMHIINISFSNYLGNNGALLSSFVEQYTQRGIIITASTGNIRQMQKITWTSNVPSIAPSVISVGSMDIPYIISDSFKAVGLGTDAIMYKNICFNIQLLLREYDVITMHYSEYPDQCTIPNNANGKIVWMPYDGCDISRLFKNMKNSGVVGSIILNSDKKYNNCLVPAISVGNQFAKIASELIAKGQSLRLGFYGHKSHVPDTSSISGSISAAWGPSLDLGMNPDIMAPGVAMFTTTNKAEKFQIDRGTSFAAPYVAGVAALYLQAHASADDNIKRFNPVEFKKTIQSTAIPCIMPHTQLAGSVAQQGAGLVCIDRAMLVSFTVSPSVIELGDRQTKAMYQDGKLSRITIYNPASVVKTFTTTHLPAVSMRGFDSNGKEFRPPQICEIHAKAIFSKYTSVEPETSVSISIKFDIPLLRAYKDHWLYSGYIIVDPDHKPNRPSSSQAIYIPYFGLNGSINNIRKMVKQP